MYCGVRGGWLAASIFSISNANLEHFQEAITDTIFRVKFRLF